MSKRKLRNSGVTTDVTLDSAKTYKYNSSGAIVELTGSAGDDDIVFTGSKSSLRRLADLERNVSILAAKSLTEDGSSSGYYSTIDYAQRAGKWSSSRTITLGGDLSGSVSFDGSANATLTATIGANSVALGTDTTGNYMVNVSAGTGISVSHTQSEGSTATITNTDLGSSQNIFKNFTDGSTTAAADSNNDTFKFRGSAGVTVAVASDDATHGDSLLISLSSVPNSSLANSSITVAGTSVSLGGSVSISTSNVSEGSNLYYTDARARAAITGGTGVTVSTGVVSIGQAVGTGSSVQFNAIGIGTAAGATAGTIRATNEITAYYSDKRLKENIKPIENALAKTLQLHGVTYNANDVAASFGYTNKEAQVGLLAQDVKAVLPEVVVPAPFDLVVRDGKEVSKSGQDFMTVKYEKIVALLVEAIKELNDKVESLEAQLGGSKSL